MIFVDNIHTSELPVMSNSLFYRPRSGGCQLERQRVQLGEGAGEVLRSSGLAVANASLHHLRR